MKSHLHDFLWYPDFFKKNYYVHINSCHMNTRKVGMVVSHKVGAET